MATFLLCWFVLYHLQQEDSVNNVAQGLRVFPTDSSPQLHDGAALLQCKTDF